MSSTKMTDVSDLHAVLAQVLRADRGRLLSALIASLGSFDLAEEALSDATESALVHWARNDKPDNPQGWLLKVARRKAIDRIRHAKRFRAREPELARLAAEDEMAANEPTPEIPDERLRLVFTCCHPSLEPKTQVALTLRTIGGLTTPEVARAFLDTETTMGQRLSRARSKIAKAGIPFAIPDRELWAERLDSVLAVIYLIFNEGYGAATGDDAIRISLCDEAVFLVRLLDQLKPEEPEVEGLLSLILTTHARKAARRDLDGNMIPMNEQDRSLWDRAMIAEGASILDAAMTRSNAGPYQIKAAIAALHTNAKTDQETDWRQIVRLYDGLFRFEPTPVVALNRATALAEAGGLRPALVEFERLKSDLAEYQPYHAACAEYRARDGQISESIAAYDKAIQLAGTAADRAFLIKRKARLPH